MADLAEAVRLPSRTWPSGERWIPVPLPPPLCPCPIFSAGIHPLQIRNNRGRWHKDLRTAMRPSTPQILSLGPFAVETRRRDRGEFAFALARGQRSRSRGGGAGTRRGPAPEGSIIP